MTHFNSSTEADHRLELAKEDVQQAISSLGSIVISKCSGSEDFTESRIRDIEQALTQLLQVRKLLEPKKTI